MSNLHLTQEIQKIAEKLPALINLYLAGKSYCIYYINLLFDIQHLIKYSMNDRIPYLGDYNTRRSTNIMHHLACFFPGVLTLGASENICGTKNRDLKIAYIN